MIEQSVNFIEQGLSFNTVGILFSLVAMETVLSADNAVALAALVQHLPEPEHQRRALNWGLVGAFGLRILLILLATWVIQFWEFEFLGALYLIWLTAKYFRERLSENQEDSLSEPFHPQSNTNLIWQIIPIIALTDLAFSLDSVTTAIAISNETWLILFGGIIGVITLRFSAGLFIKLLDKYVYLQDAAYMIILGIGLKLMIKALFPIYALPDWIVLTFVSLLLMWGFSKRVEPETSQSN
ncbi:TerC family protein [Gloeothece verrucosa]|uniref:Integral membrane protein TerC n=1 Tax=Gloeothece verrucosa (strain PCC 7822) TaxID=497965 RepID=E0U5H3_GLOV7|nr:DUF475 domain-containing protein [Gloeothece verrucosa]ADN13563.1 Integral membrane protein TerC [Gloeothece verrucosa PCC 7822]